jgi:Cu(I)/Ag(I) efflux system membrane fusion protein
VVENIPEDVTPASSSQSNGMENNSSSMQTNNQEELILRQGAYLNRGSVIFKVVNTDVVWGIFEIYSDQLPLIKLNQTVTIKIENRDEPITGKVDFIEPNYQGGSKTSRFRVYLNNKDGKLKIGNLLQGELVTDTRQVLWIPESSVYDLGIDKIVFVKKGEVFESRKITTGIRANNLLEVVNGLGETEEVAVDAQYLVDSESFIKVNNE